MEDFLQTEHKLSIRMFTNGILEFVMMVDHLIQTLELCQHGLKTKLYHFKQEHIVPAHITMEDFIMDTIGM